MMHRLSAFAVAQKALKAFLLLDHGCRKKASGEMFKWANTYTMEVAGSCNANNVNSGRRAAQYALAEMKA